MASSSSCDHNKSYQYDVFLSFSGEDTRKTFVDHLYAALDQQGICTFKDDEKLEKGRNISDDLLQSIKESRLYIIVFSKSYASSSWCLNELLKIIECHKTKEHTAFPVFYDVDPSEVRKQNGLVGEALNMLKINKNESEVGKWREALTEAANLSGWDVKKIADGHEAKVIKLIVERVFLALPPIDDTTVDENLVGMEQRMQDLDPCLEIGSNDVRVIGIKGMGGAGKTTLARAIFDKISIYFDGTSFVENVRERASQSGLKKLQKQVLGDVLKDNSISVKGVYEGKNLIKKKLRGKKVLVVLDDVDREEQLEELAGDPNWFKPGTRIIITTRDEQVLNTYTTKWIIDVNLLSDEEAIRLFSRHAFRRNFPTQEYQTESCQVVRYAAGLPLTIKVLGSFLRGKNKPEWIDALARLKTIPLKETLKMLELSYKSLEDDYKEIFLDVACFLRNWNIDDAIRFLESCGFRAKIGLRVLEQKSLIKIARRPLQGRCILMHDHIVEMAENIIRREHPDEPNKHSRLWVQEEIEHVLANGLGTEATLCVDLKITPGIVLESLGNMKKLRCLFVNRNILNPSVMIDEARQYFPNSLQYLFWNYYPHWCLPKTFEANNLVALNMSYSNIEQLWEGEKVMKNLKFLFLKGTALKSLDLGLVPNLKMLHLEYCHNLVKLNVHGGCLVYLNVSECHELRNLDLGLVPNLERLQIESCFNLVTFNVHGECLKSLVFLNLSRCEKLSNLESCSVLVVCLKRLVFLNLSGCKKLRSLDLGLMPNLETLHLRGCYDLVELYVNGVDGCLKSLVFLDLTSCQSLKSFLFINKLESLEVLHMDYLNLKEFPITGHSKNSLLELHHSENNDIEEVPSSIGNLHKLVSLDLHCCFRLKSLPASICSLQHLRTLNLRSTSIEELPDNLGQLKCLEKLDLSFTYVKHLPGSICMLKHLKTLNLTWCDLLEKLPEDVGLLESLEELDLSKCYNLKDIPSSICKLKHLKELQLESCRRLEKLPDDLGDLECLQELNILFSGITHLPPSISLLKGLKIWGVKQIVSCA